MNQNDEAACQSRPATNINSPGAHGISEPGRIPVLIVEFPLEGGARVMNSRDLTNDDVVRLADWISSRATFPGLAAWAARVLAVRGERAA